MFRWEKGKEEEVEDIGEAGRGGKIDGMRSRRMGSSRT